jgi:hypothetical protein
MAYNLEKARATVAESRTGLYWKPRVGKTLIRVLPGIAGKTYQEGEDLFFFGRCNEHRIRGEGGSMSTFTCLKPKFCPACVMASILDESGDQDHAKDLRAKISWTLNVVTGPKEDPLIWQPSGQRMEDLFDILADPDFGDFTDPKKGFCIAVMRKGEGAKTRYTLTGSLKTFPLPTDWKETAHNLNTGTVRSRSQILDMLVDRYEDKYDNIASEIMARRPKKEGKTDDAAE